MSCNFWADISYDDINTFDYFSVANASYQWSTWVEMFNPMSFTLKGTGKLNLDFSYNYNKYTHSNHANQSNSIFVIQPSIELNKWNATIKVGVNPSFTTKEFALFPVVQFSKKLFSQPYLTRLHKTFRISPRPTPPAEFLGNGVAQSIKAVQLDQ